MQDQPTKPKSFSRRLRHVVPLLDCWPRGAGAWRADIVAGATVALFLVPQAMAYAQLAGLPAHYGLYAAWLPPIITGFLGRCPQLHTGPVAIQSLMTLAVLTALPGLVVGTAAYAEHAMALALLSGAILLLLGLLRLASLVNLLSHPVIVGFTNAAALVILASQVNQVLQLPMGHGTFFAADFVRMLHRLPDASLPSLGFAIGTLAAVVLMKRLCPRCPGILLAVVLATLVSAWTGYEACWGGAVVGDIPSGIPSPHFPRIEPGAWMSLLPAAGIVAMVGFVEVLSICKVIAVKTRQRQDFNQELVAQGLASLAGGLVRSYPVSGSFSRSAVSLYTGTRTGLASVVSGLVVAAVLLWCTPALHHLPRAVLGAVIMLAVSGLLDFPAMLRIGRAGRADAAAVWLTFVATLLLAPHITHSILIGALFAIAVQIYRLMTPHVARLARHPDGTLRDARRHGLPLDPRILALRFDGRLIFTNASHFEDRLIEARSETPGMRAFLLDAEAINDLDASGEEMLRRVFQELHAEGCRVVVARLRGRARDIFARTGLDRLVGAPNLVASPEAALTMLEAWLDAGGPPSAAPS
jgi:SulP family sulfate permease